MVKKKTGPLDADILFKFGKAEKLQQSQIFDLQGESQEIKDGLDLLENLQKDNYKVGKGLIDELETLLDTFENQNLSDETYKSVNEYFDEYLRNVHDLSSFTKYDIKKTKEVITNNDWEYYFDRVTEYSKEIGIDDKEDPFLSLLGEQEYKNLENEIDGEFEKRTSIKNKRDIKFLAIAVALEVAKGLLFPLVSENMGYGSSFDPEDRLNHNDRSIEKAHREANDNFKNANLKKHSSGKWIEFLYQTVPYDITAGTGNMQDINLHGGLHRLYTLGHDPILGWIFGTANILTDVVTVSPGAIVQENQNSGISKIVGIRSYKVQRKPRMMILPQRISTMEMFNESYYVIREHPLNLPAAVFAEAQHLKSDAYTKMGLPSPLLESFDSDFSSKLYKNNYDALCFARDMKIVGKSAMVSLIIDMLIGLIHGMYFNPQKDGSRDLYEVRTRKILLIANAIGTSSNLIFSFCTQNIKSMDIGGLLVTLSHLFKDTKFMIRIKKEFIDNKVNEKIKNEIVELDKIEADIIKYGEKHRFIYD